MTEQLTRDEILVMKPGSKLDALVAEKVMGWEYKDAIYSWGEVLRPSQWIKPNGWPVDRVSCYSTDISAAWEVVEKFHEVSVKRFETMKGHRYWCKIEIDYNSEPIIAQGDTAPKQSVRRHFWR